MHILTWHILISATCALAVGVPCLAGEPRPSDAAQAESPSPDHVTRSIRGRVVWMYEAIRRHHGIKTGPETAERVLALEADDGQLVPILEDIRGRSFRRDKRLRGIDVEMLVRQHKGSPFVQVIQVFAVEADGKYELDYWCEICAIAMFELKACDCCQGDIELRRRKLAK